MSKRKSLSWQFEQQLISQLRIGESKHKAKIAEGTHSPDGIFSWGTFHSYKKVCTLFARWVKEHYPTCRTVEDAKAYVAEFLRSYIDANRSRWTIHQYASALAKAYHCHTGDFGVALPPRCRGDIIRSRGVKAHDSHFSESKNQAVVDFCRGTGLRRRELMHLQADNVAPDGSYVYVTNGKGGKTRLVPVLPKYRAHVAACAAGKTGKVFQPEEIKNRMDEHAYRREYAQALYELWEPVCARAGHTKRYHCRRDKKGRSYNRAAMRRVSLALGHNRISVIAGHYLD